MAKKKKSAKKPVKKQPKIFVSYPHEHKGTIKFLVEFLRLASDEVFFDDDIKPGDKWEDVLAKALKASPVFIVFWCRHSLASEWVAREVEWALAENKRIVPIRIDETPVPEPLQGFQWIIMPGEFCMPRWRDELSDMLCSDRYQASRIRHFRNESSELSKFRALWHLMYFVDGFERFFQEFKIACDAALSSEAS